ncbi:MAG: hypothetical protein ABIR96_04125 [Bdellovibrionota bacterium]
MKNFKLASLIVALALTHSAFANEANMFTCVGSTAKKEKVELVYTSTSLTGQPTLALKIAGQQILPANSEQDEISVLSDEQTVSGTMVSASLNRRHIADAPDLTHTVLIPTVILDSSTNHVKFDSVLLSGYSGGFRHSPLVVQVLSSVVKLKCDASYAAF